MTDYSTYEMNQREKLIFFAVGYILFFIVVFLFFHSLILSGFCGCMIFFCRRIPESYLCRRRKRRLQLQFKDLLYSLSASISAGHSMEDSMEEAYENLKSLYPETSEIMEELRIINEGYKGRESETVFYRDFGRRSGLRDISGFFEVYLAVRNSGGNLERAMLSASEQIMEKIGVEMTIQAQVSQKKTEARIITMMPFVILAAVNVISSDYIRPLYETLQGRAVMSICLLIIGFAIYMTEKITDIKV